MNSPDLLEQAHLAYLRGNKEESRDLIEAFLSMQPNNRSGLVLRAKIDRDLVRDAAIVQKQAQANYWEELSGSEVVAYSHGGLLALGLGLYLGVDALRTGLQIGFKTLIPYSLRGGSTVSLPEHLLFIQPLILIPIGIVLLRKVYRHYRG